VIRRGEIYFIDLDPVVGREQWGRRPVLVLSIDRINRKPLVVTVVPGTDGANIPQDFDTNIRLPASETGLPIETVFLCFQVRALDHSRFPQQAVGGLSAMRMRDAEAVVRFCLGL
jgi:mRNA interferase MazF